VADHPFSFQHLNSLQQISNQLEYRLIKRRLETGTAEWTEWIEEEEDVYLEKDKEMDLEPPPSPPPQTMQPPPPPPTLHNGVDCGCELYLEKAESTITTDLEAITTKRVEPTAFSITSQTMVTTNYDNQPVSLFTPAPKLSVQPGFSARLPVATTDSKRSLSLQRGEAWVRPHLLCFL
jgi:hypothetical protein